MEQYPYYLPPAEEYPYDVPFTAEKRPTAAQTFAYAYPVEPPSTPLAELRHERPDDKLRPQRTQAAPMRMSKPQALALARSLKKYLVIGSLVSFGAFGWLALTHTTGTTTNQMAPGDSAGSSQPDDTQPAQQPGSGGFFDQGGNNFGSGGFGQGPISGSSTS